MSGISVNEDSTHFYYNRPAEDMTTEGVDRFLDTYTGTAVREMMFNVNARHVSYPSKVWPRLWDGYDPDAEDQEAFHRNFSGKAGDRGKKLEHLAHNLWLLERRGIDSYARWLAGCRAAGIAGYISLRMNDLHHMQMPLAKRRALLERADPPTHRVSYRRCMTMQDGAPDYAQPAVYEHFMALVREVAGRYDLDGLELDFTRHFWLLRPGRGVADQPVITRFVRETRQVLDAQQERRGHRIHLAAVVPPTERSSRWLGMDAVLWAREGLVDYVMPSPRWASVVFEMPIDEWKRWLDGTGAMLGARMEPRVSPYPGYRIPAEQRQYGMIVNPELARGAAATYLHQGADRVVLMNFFDDRRDSSGRLLLREGGLLNDVGSLDALAPKPRRHMVTYQDALGPGEPQGCALPLAPSVQYEGDPYFGELRIDTGPKPAGGAATVVLAFDPERPDPPGDFEVYVNGCKAAPLGRIDLAPPAPANPHGFDLSTDALNDGHNLLELMSDSPWAVHWAEIRLHGG